MHTKTTILVIALASVAQAWSWSLPKFITSNSFGFSSFSSLGGSSGSTKTGLSVRQGSSSGSSQNVSCVLEDLRTVAGCACFVASSRIGLNPNDRDLCSSLLQFNPAEQERSCASFRTASGQIQIYRLIHIIFNSLESCNVERVTRDTRAAISGGTKPPKTTVTTRPPNTTRPRTTRRTKTQPSTRPSRIISVSAPSDQNDEELSDRVSFIVPTSISTTSTIGCRRAVGGCSSRKSANPPCVGPSCTSPSVKVMKDQALVDGRTAEEASLESGISHVVIAASEKMSNVDGSKTDQEETFSKQLSSGTVLLRMGARPRLPFRRSAIFGVLQVLSEIGNILRGIFDPKPSLGQSATLLRTKFIIRCTIGGRRTARVILPAKAVQLMINNRINVEVPITNADVQGGTTRMGRTMRIGVVRCRPDKVGGRLEFRCACVRRRS